MVSLSHEVLSPPTGLTRDIRRSASGWPAFCFPDESRLTGDRALRPGPRTPPGNPGQGRPGRQGSADRRDFPSAATTFSTFYQLARRIPGIPDTKMVATDRKSS